MNKKAKQEKILSHRFKKIEREYDHYNAYPLQSKDIASNDKLMKRYREGYQDGLNDKPRAKSKSYVFQEAYDIGYLEGIRDF